MLPPDYVEAVLAEYRKKKAAGKLPFDMKQLSPARFKAACLEVRGERYDRKDEKLLKAFFKEAADQKACLQAIDRCKIDIFKPLINFLKEKTSTPADDKHIELLAWLVDFKDRPCEPLKKYPSDEITANPSQDVSIREALEARLEEPDEKEGSNPVPSGSNKIQGKRKRIVLTLATLAAIGAIVLWVVTRKASTPFLNGHEACMYWTEDHYQPVSCSQKMENVQVIALDSEMVLHFRKITRPDTITDKAIGYVWYVRYRKDYEFYTADGFHPIDPTLRLRPITEYIIRNHIHPKP